jgi:hypothetical protein
MKRTWYRSILGGISFSTALFIFQCCYGTPQDLLDDVMVQGMVKSKATGEVIQGIKVSVDHTGQHQMTGEDGSFGFYVDFANPLKVSFQDVDGSTFGSFYQKDTLLQDIWEHVYMEIELDEE